MRTVTPWIKTLVLCQGASPTFFGRCARDLLLWRRRQGGHFHHEGFVACGLPGEEECVAAIALGPWALQGIQGLHGTARNLHNHDGMGRGWIAQEVTLHPNNRRVTALERLPEVIEAPVRVERHTRTGVDLTSVFLCCRAAVKVMPRRGRPRRVRTCPSVHTTSNPVSTIRTQAATHDVGCSCAYQVSIRQCHRPLPSARHGG